MVDKRKRTKKEFREYNEYHDRPFGLKWGTAYAMEELVKGITNNESYALKENHVLEQMEQVEIDPILSESMLYSKEIEIQLNLRDEFGRFVDPITGIFQGEAYEDYFVMNDKKILWSDVRHVELMNNKKWLHIDIFDSRTSSYQNSDLAVEKVEYVKDEFYQPFYDESDV